MEGNRRVNAGPHQSQALASSCWRYFDLIIKLDIIIHYYESIGEQALEPHPEIVERHTVLRARVRELLETKSSILNQRRSPVNERKLMEHKEGICSGVASLYSAMNAVKKLIKRKIDVRRRCQCGDGGDAGEQFAFMSWLPRLRFSFATRPRLRVHAKCLHPNPDHCLCHHCDTSVAC